MEGGNSATTAQKFKLTDLLKELITTQAQVSKVDAAHFQTSTKNFVSGKITSLKEYVDKQAKDYKQSKTEIASVIEYYEDILTQAKSAFKREKKALMQEKADWEQSEDERVAEFYDKKQEFKQMPGYKEFAKRKAEITQLKKQGRTEEADKKREEFNEYKAGLPKRVKALQAKIALCIQNGDTEAAEMQMKTLKKLQRESKLAERDSDLGKIKSQIELCRKSIKEQNKKIESCEKDFKEEVEKITGSQERALSKVDKQNVFQKLLVKVFGSAKQFNNNVMSPLKQKMDRFKNETLPIKIEDMEKQAKKRGKYIVEKTGKAAKTVGRTFASIIDGARRAKNTVVNGLEKKMADRIDKNRQKITAHNLDNPDVTVENSGVKAQYGKYANGILTDTSHDEI